MPPFIPGIELSRRFYAEAVRPALDAHYPGLPHAAARVGYGSDVLGYDTEMSTDHGWGPTATIFLRDEDAGLAGPIRELLRHHLPHEFYGYPVSTIEFPDEPGIPHMHPTSAGPVEHRVVFTTVRAFWWEHVAHDLDQPIEVADWLTITSQQLLEITAGAVYHDGVGELTRLRERLAWYPHDVWLYLLAAGWARIGQEEHLMPRAGYVGDELGSALIGSRLVRDIMSLSFLIERRYAPYPKWFGTAFKRLRCAADLAPALWRAQRAETWQGREAALCEAYEYLARAHNALGITEPLPERVSAFHGRPFQVIQGDVFASAFAARIVDPEVARLAARRRIGSIDQFSDSTDLHEDTPRRAVLRDLYRDLP